MVSRAPFLDFARPQASPGRARTGLFFLGWLLLGLVVGFMAWQYQSLASDRMELETQRQSSQQRFDRANTFDPNQDTRPQLLSAKAMLQNLGRPWEKIFSALERARDDKIVIESIRGDPSERKIEITAHAPDFVSAAEFVDRLAATKPLVRVLLVSENQNAPRVGSTQFVVSASWTEVHK